jgi:hypothetical protein
MGSGVDVVVEYAQAKPRQRDARPVDASALNRPQGSAGDPV